METILIWQREIWATLMQKQNLRCHALLLKGRKGTGKLSFARLLAQSLLCIKPNTGHFACGQCASCHWFVCQTHPNFTMITPESMAETCNTQIKRINHSKSDSLASHNKERPVNNKPAKSRLGQQISIDQIRGLDDFVFLTGHQEGYKIVLIYPAEAMNNAAASALLKKLEEPPEQTLFILVAHQFQHVLPTIRSRCQQVTMPVPEAEEAVRWMMQRCFMPPEFGKPGESQKLQDPQHAHMLLALSGYSPLYALSLQGEIEEYQQFIGAIGEPERFDPMALSQVLQNQDLSVTVHWLQKWCYDLISFSVAGRIRYHLHWKAQISRLSKQVNPRACMNYLRFLNSRQLLSRHPVNNRLFLEEIFIHYEKLLVSASSVPDFPAG